MLAPSPATPAVSLVELKKSVPGGRVLFDRLSFDLKPGEFVAVMGESGVGKSTLLNLIAGLELPDAGRIAIAGRDLAALSEDNRAVLRRERIGFVFQAFHILPHLTLGQNAALPLLLQHVPAGESKARASAMLEAVGLSGRANDYPRQLSGGELQRVAIARALVHRPQLILADEPTGNLDPETALRIRDLLAAQVREADAAAILVTHSDMVAGIADRALTLTAHGLFDRGR